MKPDDFRYSLFDSPIGLIGLLSCEGRLSQLLFTKSESTCLSEIKSKTGFAPTKDKTSLEKWHSLLNRYFNGEAVSWEEPMGFLTGTDLQKRIWNGIAGIPYGAVQSYLAVADRVGIINGARAVGSACAANPIPIIIPCHRVVCKNGSLGGYSGGGSIAIKKKLLAIEGVFPKTKEG